MTGFLYILYMASQFRVLRVLLVVIRALIHGYLNRISGGVQMISGESGF